TSRHSAAAVAAATVRALAARRRLVTPTGLSIDAIDALDALGDDSRMHGRGGQARELSDSPGRAGPRPLRERGTWDRGDRGLETGFHDHAAIRLVRGRVKAAERRRVAERHE